MDTLLETLNDISKTNVIYTVLILAATSNTAELNFLVNPSKLFQYLMMSFNDTIESYILSTAEERERLYSAEYVGLTGDQNYQQKPSLFIRLIKRLTLYSETILAYLQSHFNERTATSIASFSVLIIVLSIICCFILSMMREEERKIKEQYRKLQSGSSSSVLAIQSNDCSGSSASEYSSPYYYSTSGYRKISNQQSNPTGSGPAFRPVSISPVPGSHSNQHKLRLFELRRETYYGLVRLLKPGCRTIVLLCDAQSKIKLLTKYHQCVYPYRKNKTLQFAFLLIEKNISWYKDLLRLALGEKRDLQINPINCIGTVLALNGFKKYFSVYHASDSRCEIDEPCILLEESLLDGLPNWLERLFAGKVNRYYVGYWPDRMR